MLAHEPPERGSLVRRVVVDVQVGIAAAALDEPVDEAAEGVLLAGPVEAPDRVVAELAVLVAEAVAEEVLEPARGLVERVALEVEPDVAGRGGGEQPEARVLLVREELVAVLAGLPVEELETCLLPQSVEDLRADVLDLGVGRGVRELRQRRDARRREPLRVQAPEPGDEHEVVVVLPPLPAEVAEVADPAVVAGPGPGGGAVRERGEEALARAPEERDEVRRSERLPHARAELDVDVLGQAPLDPLELGRVEAELEEVPRLRGAGELRVHGFVRAVRQALEEVGEPAPGAVREVGLVDDVRLCAADGLLGRAPRLVGVEVAVLVGAHAGDARAVGLEPREVGALVLVPLPHDELAVRVVDVRPRELAALDEELELRQVRAGEVVRQIGRREPKRAVIRESHPLEYQRRTGRRLCDKREIRSITARGQPASRDSRSLGHLLARSARKDPVLHLEVGDTERLRDRCSGGRMSESASRKARWRWRPPSPGKRWLRLREATSLQPLLPIALLKPEPSVESDRNLAKVATQGRGSERVEKCCFSSTSSTRGFAPLTSRTASTCRRSIISSLRAVPDL